MGWSNRRRLLVGSGIAAVLLLIGAALAAHAVTGWPSARAVSSRSPVPAPTLSQAAQAQAWRDAITPSLNRLGDAIDGIQVGCDPSAAPGFCGIAYGAVATAAQGVERSLDTHEAPACLTDVAAQLRQAVGLVDSASTSIEHSATLRDELAGVAVMQDALVHLRAARTEAQGTSC